MSNPMFSFRCSLKAHDKIRIEAGAQRIPVATYIRAIIETALDEPAEERNELLAQHEVLLEGTQQLSRIILSTERYLRVYDLDVGSFNISEMMQKGVKE